MTAPLHTPVVLLVYNRPEQAARVFEAVRQARPARLFVIADGPRADRPGDADRCTAARTAVERIDWPCEVARDYADHNLGIKRRVDGGFSRVFAHAEEAIILEDDCLPHPSFFPFCQELLGRYRAHDRVMMIGGSNFLDGEHAPPASYGFTRYPLPPGWATWRRAWARYDPAMSRWPDVRSTGWLAAHLQDPAAAYYWARVFSDNYDTLEHWDYAWVLACWLHDGLCAYPAVNLVSNIGYGPDATHTTDVRDPFAARPTAALPLPWTHPPEVAPEARANALIERKVFSGRYLLRPLFQAMRAHVRSLRPR
jgi:hypothetical protein